MTLITSASHMRSALMLLLEADHKHTVSSHIVYVDNEKEIDYLAEGEKEFISVIWTESKNY